MEAERPIYPLIEAVTNDATWTVLPNKTKGWHGSSVIEKKTIAVPVDNSEEALGTRTHELCHVAYSPSITLAKKLALDFGINDFDWVLCVEDGRIQTIAISRKIKFPSSIESLYKTSDRTSIQSKMCVRFSENQEQFLKICVASIATPDHVLYRGIIESSSLYRKLLDHVTIILTRSKHLFFGTLICAKYLESFFEKRAAEKEEREKHRADASEYAKGIGVLDTSAEAKSSSDLLAIETDFDGLKSLIGGASDDTELMKDTDFISKLHKKIYAPTVTNKWGTMKVVEKPRPQNMLKHCHITPKKRIGEYGTVPSAMHRWCSDQNVFVTKVHMPGGTLLIDTSSSMHFIRESVYDLVKIAPMITIATYCGNGSTGELWVIAKNGMVAVNDDLYLSASGNIIDGPALEWLGSQKEPRVWIADGQVTGIGDRQTKNLIDDAKNIIKKHHIIRVDAVEGAKKVFQLIEQKRFREVYGYTKN